MVASTVAMPEAKAATTTERTVASCTFSFSQASTYQRSENPSQSARFGPALNE